MRPVTARADRPGVVMSVSPSSSNPSRGERDSGTRGDREEAAVPADGHRVRDLTGRDTEADRATRADSATRTDRDAAAGRDTTTRRAGTLAEADDRRDKGDRHALPHVDRSEVVAREKERYGGIKWGSAL